MSVLHCHNFLWVELLLDIYAVSLQNCDCLVREMERRPHLLTGSELVESFDVHHEQRYRHRRRTLV